MQVTAEQTDPCTMVLDIEVEEEQVSRTFDSVYREFSRYVNIPGFRPGKAPRSLVERYVNKEKVRERTMEKLISETCTQAIKDQGVTPFRQPTVEPTDLEDQKPYAYKATIPLEPQITLGEYTGITVEKPIFPITEAMVENQIDKLREERAKLERITDRGVEAGDVLIAENQVVLEGEEAGEPARRQILQLGQNIPGFDEAVLGTKIGEERTFELTYPDDFQEEARRGKKATFTVKIHSISAKQKPPLDDAFAKEMGGGETVEEFREAVRTQLGSQTVTLSNQIAEQRIIEKILENSEVYFPEALVRDEAEEMFQGLGRELRERQMTYENYLLQIGQTAEVHQQEVIATAAARVRTILALRQVAIQEGLQASDEMVDAEFDRLLTQGRITEDQYADFKADDRRRIQVANALVQQKLHDFLFANNTINEVVQETPPDADELAEAVEVAAETTE